MVKKLLGLSIVLSLFRFTSSPSFIVHIIEENDDYIRLNLENKTKKIITVFNNKNLLKVFTDSFEFTILNNQLSTNHYRLDLYSEYAYYYLEIKFHAFKEYAKLNEDIYFNYSFNASKDIYIDPLNEKYLIFKGEYDFYETYNGDLVLDEMFNIEYRFEELPEDIILRFYVERDDYKYLYYNELDNCLDIKLKCLLGLEDRLYLYYLNEYYLDMDDFDISEDKISSYAEKNFRINKSLSNQNISTRLILKYPKFEIIYEFNIYYYFDYKITVDEEKINNYEKTIKIL